MTNAVDPNGGTLPPGFVGYMKEAVDTINDLQIIQPNNEFDLRYVKEDNKLYIYRNDVSVGDIESNDAIGYWLAINDTDISFVVDTDEVELKAIFDGDVIKEILITVLSEYQPGVQIMIGDTVGEASLVTQECSDLTVLNEVYGFNPVKRYTFNTYIKVKFVNVGLGETGQCLICISVDKAYVK